MSSTPTGRTYTDLTPEEWAAMGWSDDEPLPDAPRWACLGGRTSAEAIADGWDPTDG